MSDGAGMSRIAVAHSVQLEIVRSKGLEPLLKFTSSEDQGLVGLIFYSMSKVRTSMS